MSFISKIGGFIKKALPYAGAAAALIPGVGTLASGAMGALGGMFSAKSSPQPNPAPADASDGTFWGAPASASSPPQGKSTDWMGVAQAAAPLVTGGLNYVGQKQMNAANAKQAQAQMDFQNQQTSTSWQRGVQDMKAAGLNPMLAYSQGGASSGAGAMSNQANEYSGAASSALDAATTLKQLENMDATNKQIEAQTDATRAGAERTRVGTATDLIDRQRVQNVAKGSVWEPKQQEERAMGLHYANWLAGNTMEAAITNAKQSARRATADATQAEYGLAKGKAYQDYYEDKNVLKGGYYEGGRRAVQETAASAGQAARDITGSVRNLIPFFPE